MIPDREPPYAGIAFDCDSTLSSIEGVEEIASGHPQLEELTRRAMAGEIALEDVYAQRLEWVRPGREDLLRVGRRYVETRLPHADELIAALRELGKRVVIVSGGLLPAVRVLAEALGVPATDTFAVDVEFHEDGSYRDFDRSSPLARSKGKPELVRELRAATPGPWALVGDGATDLEAAPELDRFVAFGGVERRAAVFDRARVRCAEPDLAALLPWLADAAEIESLAESERHRALVRAAQGVL